MCILGDNMDISRILADLRAERVQIEEAIITLERLAEGRGKRRGRPPTWLVEARKQDGKAPVTPLVVKGKEKVSKSDG